MLDSCAIFHGKNMYPLSIKLCVQCSCAVMKLKNMNTVVWHLLIGFPIYAILSLAACYFCVGCYTCSNAVKFIQ